MSKTSDKSEPQMEDPMVALRQLEQLISEAEEFESKPTNFQFNGNKLLNELLDKPIDANLRNNDNEVSDEDDDNEDSEEDNDMDIDSKDTKESIETNQLEEDSSEQHMSDNNNSHKSTPNSKNKNKRKRGSNSKNPQMRKNIKSIMTETDLDKETIAARKLEEERMARQRERSHQRLQEMQSQINTAFNSNVNHSTNSSLHKNYSESFSEIQDEVVLSSDEEENAGLHQNHISLNSSFTPVKSSTEIIDLSSGDEESDATAFRPQYSQYSSGIRLDYNMVGAYDEDDVAIISNDTEDNIEDLNNCGSHTDDKLNTPDAEGRVLVNVAHPPEDEDIFLASQIAKHVKPHQIGGIRFLYDNVIESIERYNDSPGFGCILSHSMGLGKTMQVIALIDVFLAHTPAKYVLCIVPINTLQNWIAEFNMWLPEDGSIDKYFKNENKDNDNNDINYRKFKVFALNEAKSYSARAKEILKWRKFGGVLLLGYEMYRILTSDQKKKSTKDNDIDPKMLAEINRELQAALIDPGPDLVICDEGHRIKNCNAATSMALKNIKTRRRVVLTGYPLQNNLIEYWCMVDFVRPNYLGLKPEFTNMFERPIVNGQCSDSTPHDRRLMRFRAHVLYQLLKGFVQRRSHSVLKLALPTKHEYVLLCRMSKIQKDLMLAFLDTAINDPNSIGTASGRISTLLLFSVCCKIWNHPDIVYDIVRKGIFTDDLDIEIPAKNKKPPKNKKKQKELTSNIESLTLQQSSVSQFIDTTNNLFDTPLRSKNEGVIDYSWADRILSQYKPGIIENSSKMVVLFEIIKETMACGDRLLVFSQSLFTLDLIERFLQSRQVPNSQSNWCKNQTYYRLDGSTTGQDRERYINQFNNNTNAHLFLISTRAGCLGINLIGANRIVIFDASWNPCHDAQAACRIYRYGQQKPCFIYRLICDNSLEKKIYDRQVNKQGMANRVVDEQNVETNFTWREIHSLLDDLHQINEPPVQQYSDEQLSKYEDHMVKHICTQLNHYITRIPFEHESLLLDRKETKLTNTEKKIAEYQYSLAKQQKQAENSIGLNSIRSQTGSRFYSTPNPYNANPYFMSASSAALPTQVTPNPNNFYDNMPYPDISQPLPPYPPQPRTHSSTNFNFTNFESIAETLVRNGNSVKKVKIPKDLNINISPTNTITIRKGEEVMIIQTQKGLYLRTSDGNIISIKNSLNFDKSFATDPLPSFIPISQNDSFGIIQPNLQSGGTVHCLPSHSRATSTVSHPPEVVQLSDDDESEDNQAIDANMRYRDNNITGISTASELSATTNGSIALDSSSYMVAENETLPIDSSDYDMSYFTNMSGDSIDSLSTSMTSHVNNNSTQMEPNSTSTPNHKLRPELHAFDSSISTAASYPLYSPTTPSTQLNGSSINLEA